MKFISREIFEKENEVEIRYLVYFVVGLIMIIASATVCAVVKSKGSWMIILIIILGIGITLISGACYTSGYIRGEKGDKSGLIGFLPP